jgi:hypothetical protein
MSGAVRRLPTIDPRTYQRIDELSLVALTLIVFGLGEYFPGGRERALTASRRFDAGQ